MKKQLFLSILIVALLPLLAFADDYNIPVFGKYGFANQESLDSYKQYIGKTVLYIPCKPLSYLEKNVFKTEKFVPGKEYVILSINKEKSSRNIVVSFQEKNGDQKLKIKSSPHFAYQYPFFFVDDFNADKVNLIGKIYRDPVVKGGYKIMDVSLENTNGGERIKEIVYDVCNPEINRKFRTTDYETAIGEYLKEDKSGSYRSTLIKVEKPEKSTERYGDVKSIDDKGVTKYSFEDDYISIIIFGSDSRFKFKLENKTQNSIKIIWDDAVYVDFNGSTSKVMHSGVKYSERENAQIATTIISRASLEDIACPIANVRYDEVLKEWVAGSMYPKTILQGKKQIRLMLPIQIKEIVNEYVFVFDIEYVYNHPDRIVVE